MASLLLYRMGKSSGDSAAAVAAAREPLTALEALERAKAAAAAEGTSVEDLSAIEAEALEVVCGRLLVALCASAAAWSTTTLGGTAQTTQRKTSLPLPPSTRAPGQYLSAKGRKADLGLEERSVFVVVPESQVVAATNDDGSEKAVGSTPVSAAARAAAAACKAEDEAKAAAEERWVTGRALLHWKGGANPSLVENAALLGVGGRNDVPRGERKRVLVPFCGNSKSES